MLPIEAVTVTFGIKQDQEIKLIGEMSMIYHARCVALIQFDWVISWTFPQISCVALFTTVRIRRESNDFTVFLC